MANNWFDEAMTLDKKRMYRHVEGVETPESRHVQYHRNGFNTDYDKGYDDDDEDDENADELPSTKARHKIPRVQTSDGAEGCSCFPKRSNKNIPSMLYEGLECKHTGLRGEMHAGVARFTGNWREKFEEADPDSAMPQKTSYVIGYPRPINLDQETDDSDVENRDSLNTKNVSKKQNNKRKTKSSKSIISAPKSREASRKSERKKESAKIEKKNPFAGFLGDVDEEPELPESKPLLEGITLPQIGFTPPPSRERQNSRERPTTKPVAKSLPPLPESPFLSSRQRGEQSNSPIDEDDNRRRHKNGSITERAFTGHYYDMGAKRTRSYEIIPQFRKGLQAWTSYKNDTKRQNRMIAGLHGRRTTNGNMYSRENITVPEDDEYDYDEEDYDEDIQTRKKGGNEQRKQITLNKLKKLL